MRHRIIRATSNGVAGISAGVGGIFDGIVDRLNGSPEAVKDFVALDPVQFPLGYAAAPGARREDVEIAAFLAATVAWGRRDMILKSAKKMFVMMQGRPADFVMSGGFEGLGERGDPGDGSVHRTFFAGDLKYFCRGFRACYEKYGTLESLFVAAGGIWQGIALFRDEMAGANGGVFSKHIGDPRNSACKRIHLALRWLVRGRPVDLSLWKTISPADLFIPLDVHVARNARRLGLLTRKSNDRKAVVELTEALRLFCPEDPVKYDFALFDNATSSALDFNGGNK